MERQEAKNTCSQNKRQHDNLSLIDYENCFNPKRAHLERSTIRTSTDNGLNSAFFNDACTQFIQSMSEIGNMFDLFQYKGADMALNLSNKKKNLSSLPAPHSSSSLYQMPKSSNDTETTPIDLSKTSHKRVSEVPRNELKRDKCHRRKEKILVMSKDEQQKEVKCLQADLREEEAKLMLLRLIKRSQQVFNNTLRTTLPSTSKTTLPKCSNDLSVTTLNGSDPSNDKAFETNHVTDNTNNHISKSPSANNSTAINHANNIGISHHSNSHHSKQYSSQGKYLSNNNAKVNNLPNSSFSNQAGISSKTSSPSLGNFYNGFSTFLNNFNHAPPDGSMEAFMASSSMYPGLARSCTPQSSRATPNSTQSEAQRHHASRLALRKQLEKSLMQIPLPKPLIPELNFVPNANSAEFVALLGLEEVVKNIVDGEARRRGHATTADIKYIFNPFKCVQCASDFTPVWKRDKPGSKNVICERCVTSNQRRALKHEHTNRLKAVFSKAALKEQELNKNIMRPPSPSTSFTNKISPSSPNLSTLMSNSSQVPSFPPPPLPLSSLSSLSSLSNLFNPSSVSKNIFSPESPYQLSATDFSNMASLFSMPPSFWSPQDFPFALNSASAQALSQQLMFPFSGSYPSKSYSIPSSSSSTSSLSAAQRQFLVDFMPPHTPQQDASPLLWRS